MNVPPALRGAVMNSEFNTAPNNTTRNNKKNKNANKTRKNAVRPFVPVRPLVPVRSLVAPPVATVGGGGAAPVKEKNEIGKKLYSENYGVLDLKELIKIADTVPDIWARTNESSLDKSLLMRYRDLLGQRGCLPIISELSKLKNIKFIHLMFDILQDFRHGTTYYVHLIDRLGKFYSFSTFYAGHVPITSNNIKQIKDENGWK